MTEVIDGWVEWAGGERPVEADVIVDFKRRMDTELVWRPEEFRAGDLRWSHEGRSTDIISYRVVRP